MKQIRLNAFEMNTRRAPVARAVGAPARPLDSYTDLDYWTELARTLERGKFDGIFLADVLGIYDVYGGSPDAALRHAVQVPVNDPLLLVPAMAAVTEHLGFGVTCTLSYEPPYTFARRMSTLDHLTSGRAGWNIVTGYLDSAATGMGLARAAAPRPALRHRRGIHAGRVQAVGGQLGGRRGGARPGAPASSPIRPRSTGSATRASSTGSTRSTCASRRRSARRCCTRPARRAAAAISPRAMPNACSSTARRPEVVAPQVADLRRRAAAHGRDPADLLIFTLCTVITGRSEAEARAKHAEYRRYADPEAALALFSGWTGVDFSRFRPDDELRYIETEAMRSALASFTSRRPGPGMDRARIGRACRDRRPRPAVRRLAGADRRHADRLGRGRPASTGSTWPTR